MKTKKTAIQPSCRFPDYLFFIVQLIRVAPFELNSRTTSKSDLIIAPKEFSASTQPVTRHFAPPKFFAVISLYVLQNFAVEGAFRLSFTIIMAYDLARFSVFQLSDFLEDNPPHVPISSNPTIMATKTKIAFPHPPPFLRL